MGESVNKREREEGGRGDGGGEGGRGDIWGGTRERRETRSEGRGRGKREKLKQGEDSE